MMNNNPTMSWGTINTEQQTTDCAFAQVFTKNLGVGGGGGVPLGDCVICILMGN